MLFATTVEIDALRAATVGRSTYSEAALIGGFLAVGGRGLGVGLEGLEFLFGGAVRTKEEQGGNKSNADDYQRDERNEEIRHCRGEGGGGDGGRVVADDEAEYCRHFGEGVEGVNGVKLLFGFGNERRYRSL